MDNKLVGYLLLVLKAKENLPRRSLIGQLCAIHGKGRQTVLKTESGVALVPLTEECEQEERSADQNVAEVPLEELGADGISAEVLGSAAGGLAEGHLSPSKRKHPGNKQGSAKKTKLEGAKSPRSVGGVGKKKKEGQAKSGTKPPQKEGLLQHIHSLAAKERLHIPACVAEVLDVPVTNGSVPLVLVCIDVYVPVDIWAGRRDWRGGVSAIAVLSHLRCDWEARVQVLEAMERVVEGGVNAPLNGVGTGSKTVELGAETEKHEDRARVKGKWKVDSWSELESVRPNLLNKPAGALIIREPGTNPEPNPAPTQPDPTLADAPSLTEALCGDSLSLEGVQELVGACQSLGCQLHPSPPRDEEKRGRFQDEKRARFNLPTLFRSLPSHLDELEGLLSRTTTYMLPGGAPAGTGMCDLPDEVLILIMEKLGAAELQRMEAVCRHTRALGAALFPSITLPLFQHQRAAARWMIARERSPSTFSNPLFRCLTSEDGFALWVNLVTGEVSAEDPPPVLDGKGGLICDEPGMGKTATSLAVIMKTRGVRAVGPSEYPKWFCKFEGMADGQAGYYVLPGNALVRHSGSANRSSRSRQSVKLAPETPNAELPRGRLMSDLKAASEPVMGKKEREERSGLEGVRRALFSEGKGGERREKKTDGAVDFEEVGRMGLEAEVVGSFGPGSEPRKRGKDVTKFPSISGDAVQSGRGFGAPAGSYPLKEEPCTPPRIAKEAIEAETSATKRRRTECAGRDEAGERVRTPEGLVQERVEQRKTKGLGSNGVDEGFKSVRFLDDLDQAGEEAWRWDDVDEGCNRIRSMSEFNDGSNAEGGEEWRSDGVDQGFKAVRSLSAVVSSGVRKGNVKHQRGESNPTEAKRSGKERAQCKEESGQNGGSTAEIVFGEEPGMSGQCFGGAKSEKARAKQTKRTKLRELAEVLRRMESLEERRRQFARSGLSNGGQGCGTDPESTERGTEASSEGGSGLQQREGGLSGNHAERGIDPDSCRSFGRFLDGSVGHEWSVGCGTAEADTERSSRLNGGFNSHDVGGKGNSFPGLGQSERALDELPIDLRTPERPNNAPECSPSPFGGPEEEAVWQPRTHTAPKRFKKGASLLDSAEREGGRKPRHRRSILSDISDGEWGGSDADQGRADGDTGNLDVARKSLDRGRDDPDAAWGRSDIARQSSEGRQEDLHAPEKSSDTARGWLDVAQGGLDTARGSSDTARGSLEAARGGLDAARGSLDAVPRRSDPSPGRSEVAAGRSDAGAGRSDIKAERLDEGAACSDAFGNGADDDGKETDAESEGQLESEWVECEACHKWRRLPPGCPRPPEDSPWFCSMNKDPLRQDCSAPSEDVVENEWSSSHPGFVAPGDPPGSAENVAYFLESLRSQLSALQNSWRAAQWLADLKSEDLEKLAAPTGVMVPYYRRDANDRYMAVYRALGLEQCLRRDPFPAEWAWAEVEGESPKRKRWEDVQRKKAEAERARSHLWRYPRHIRSGWTFDTAALKAALATPVEDARRIYLSKATLVVVPSNLIQHWLSQIRKHLPPGQLKVHVWDGNEATSPSAHKLAWEYDVVLTTFSRLSVEWANKVDSTLMHVHWLRLILDEGHTLGSSFQVTNKLQMTIALRADMRWVLTGTPTPNTPNSQVAHLHPLLKFLHEGCYGEQQKVWEAAIQKPFEAQREEGRLRLEELLRRTMISATKEDMRTIPECHRKLVMLEFTSGHAKSYNELVGTVKRNLLLADWNDPNHVESLLNPKQWKLARNTVDNVRKSCCVAGNMMVEDTPGEIEETMESLTVPPARADHIRSALKSGGHCDRCSAWSRLPFITPCAHLLCIACVSISATHCTVGECYKPYKMQLKGWRPENPSPRGPVPQDLIELQPSYTQAEWNPDWQNTQSSKLSYLKRCIQEMLASNAALLAKAATEEIDPVLPQGDVSGGEGDASASWQQLKPTKAPTVWPTGSDAGASGGSPERRPEKAIVFSEFLEYLTLVEAQLAAAGIESAAMYSPKTQGMKMHALRRFIESPTCCVLVMDSTAAVGLDLSFVSRVYLMEPIWDKSLEEQIVSRAWRMGATRPVMVETLAMRGTIEEEMVQVLQSQEEYSGKSHRETQELNARISCLSRLSPVGLPDSRK